MIRSRVRALEFGDRAEDARDEPGGRRRRVDPLAHRDECNAAVLPVVEQHYQVREVSPEPIESPADDGLHSMLTHAEKTEAMVRLALANSRMKDFFDIHRLVETRTFDGETMRVAVAATFTRRGVEIPGERPLALTSEFADDAQKKVQWAAFVRRG